MARANITIPDSLHRRAKQAGLNISRLAQHALAAELTRLARIADLDQYLAERESELGPTSETERADAQAWADRLLGPSSRRRSA